MEAERIETLTIRLKRDEAASLQRVAKKLGLTKSDLARRALALTLPMYANVKLPGTETERES
jgi:hypothetical protein